MIKINLLLAKRKGKKVREGVKFAVPTLLPLWAFLILLFVAGFIWYRLDSKVSGLKAEKTKKEQVLVSLKEKVKEVENFEKDRKSFEDKIKVIEELKRNQRGPVHLLDELSRNLPDNVWFTSIKESSGKVDLDGKARTNPDIVKLVNNLKESKHFKGVQLIESVKGSEGTVPVYNFKLRCDFSYESS